MKDCSVLVVTENTTNAQLVVRLLQDEFANVNACTSEDRLVSDFERHRPAVLILAFEMIERSERAYLGLYRTGSAIHEHPHRTIILCDKDSVRAAYELVRKQYFDDYVFFWPMTHDTYRLPMAVHHSLRQLAERANTPSATELASAARRVADLEALIREATAGGGAQLDGARKRVSELRGTLDRALDSLSDRLLDGELRGAVEVADPAALNRALDRLKREELAPTIDRLAGAVEPVGAWLEQFKDASASRLGSSAELRRLASRVRPRVLAVDDDDLLRKQLAVMLDDARWEVVFAESAAGALAAASRRRFDLILMDVQLPDTNGIELTRTLKADPRFSPVPIIMISGHSRREIIVECARAGAEGFIVKPFDRVTLFAKMSPWFSETDESSPQPAAASA